MRRPPPEKPLPSEPAVPSALDATVIRGSSKPQSAGSSPSRPSRAAVPPEAAAASEDDRFGKFIRTAKLGAGGMGEVWKAWDTQLGRWVALKFLRGGLGDEIERFEREAQTAGALTHPNIAAIYEVGEDRGMHFIAMQLVDGVTLRKLKLPDVKKQVALVVDAARAVQAAHEDGVIHRDIKPENVMVSTRKRAGGEDEHHVYVMDFGLARAAGGASDLSISGSVVGTPGYLPPEQARGEAVDERADVYALGATLYHLVARRPPFEGQSLVEILEKTQRAEPVPPRKWNPRVDRDLETIILKCLEKDRERRYDTAMDLADDLERFLEGHPILARPASFGYRLKKSLARRKALVLSGALGLIAVGVTLAVALPKLRAKEKDLSKTQKTLDENRAALSEAQRRLVGEMRATAETCLEAALELRRAGNVPGMKRLADRLEESCRKVIAEAPALAEPHYHLGRMHRARLSDTEALVEQELALSKEPGLPRALYERIVLTARLARMRMDALRDKALRAEGSRMALEGGGRMRSGTARRVATGEELAQADPEAMRLRKKVEADLAVLEKSEAALSAAERDCARGLGAWAAGRTATAKELLLKAATAAPRIEEAWETLASVDMAAGRVDEAIAWYSEGLKHDQGYAPFWLERGACRSDAAMMGKAGEVVKRLIEAIGDLDEAMKRDASGWEATRRRGLARFNLASEVEFSGGDGISAIRLAIEDNTKVLASRPRDAELLYARGAAHTLLGEFLGRRNQDFEPAFRDALADVDAAIAADPSLAPGWLHRAHAQITRALFLSRRGGDCEPVYESAHRDIDKALELDPTSRETWSHRSQLRMNWALYRNRLGKQDPDLVREAIKDLDEALRLGGMEAQIEGLRGLAKTNLGYILDSSGIDPVPSWIEALRDLDASISAEPGRAKAWFWRSGLHMHWANYEIQRGKDSSLRYEAALADLDKAISLNDSDAESFRDRGFARAGLARREGSRGKDPKAHFEAAIQDLDRALTLAPGDPGTLDARANAYGDWGVWHINAGLDPSPLFERALENGLAAVAGNPNSASFVRNVAAARVNWANWKSMNQQDPTELLSLATAEMRRGLDLDSSWDKAWMDLGVVYQNLAVWEDTQSKDSTASYNAALQHFEEALKRNPGRAETWKNRGGAHVNRALAVGNAGGDPLPLYDASAGDLAEALKLNAADAQGWMALGAVHYNRGSFIEEKLKQKPTADFVAALKAWKKATELNPQMELYIKDAKAVMETWFEKNPGEKPRE